MSAYGEFTTVMSEERYLVEGLRAMGYRVEVHAEGAALVGYHGDERRETAHVIIRRTQLDKRRGATRWNAGVEDSILKCPDRLALNDVSGVYRDLSGCWMEGLLAPTIGKHWATFGG